MLFSWIVFLAGIEQTGDPVGCIVVAVVLHYFIMASFMWMLMEGLTWVFGFLAISDARLVFQYIFTVLNSLQGFLIFILFTARDKNVRDYWKQLCCCCRISRTISKPSETTSSNMDL
ncbi:adhesion G protein-coupled receptor E5-like [Patella vulgata]|uniref:adhesion G protein-coupled receptor E5-like n=1 Tax=Patella vulgata TaxID=6465 RepID=UPI0024A8EC83|nr:adhesion G protein-coupled receptor E5-like [Patella vulgata]